MNIRSGNGIAWTGLSKTIITTCCCFIVMIHPASTQEVVLAGRLVNTAAESLSGAVIVVSNAGNKTVGRGVTDNNGLFRLAVQTEKTATLYCHATHVTCVPQHFTARLHAGIDTVDIGVIVLPLRQQLHDTAAVTQQQQRFERRADRLVFNMQKNAASAGNTLWDEILRIPGVREDAGSNLGWLGKPLAVFMNSRPVQMSGEDLAQFLRSQQLTNIVRLELITNPPSGFDAQGGYIVNIITARRNSGVYGSVFHTWEQSSFPRFRNGADITIQGNRLGFYGRLNRSDNNNLITGRDEAWFITSTATTLWQDRFRRVDKAFQNTIQAIIDYRFSKKISAGIEYNGLQSRNRSGRNYSYYVSQAGYPADSLLRTFSNNQSGAFNRLVNFNFVWKPDSTGRQLLVYADKTWYENNRNQFAGNDAYTPDGIKVSDGGRYSSANDQTVRISSVSADYHTPAGDNTRLETGLKYSRSQTTNSLGFENVTGFQLISDSARSNKYAYTEGNAAAYLSVSGQWKTFEYQGGLRYEYTHTISRQVTTGQTNKAGYRYLFPSLFLQHRTGEHVVNFSLSRRISRPEYWRLNPFRFFPNPYRSIVGNPFMKPSIMNRAEFAYSFKDWLYVSCFFSTARNSFQQLSYQDTTSNILTYYNVNFGIKKEYGILGNISLRARSWWNTAFYFQLIRQEHQSPYLDDVINNRAFQWYVSLSNTFTISGRRNITAELAAWYNSRMVQGIFINGATADVTAAFKKLCFQKKITLALAVHDIFFTRSNWGRVNYGLQQLRFIEWYDSRQFRFSAVYRFGGKKSSAWKNDRKQSSAPERDRL